MSNLTPPTDAHPAAAIQCAWRWAEFTKAASIYPSKNVRVQSALTQFLDALEEALAESRAPTDEGLQIVFAADVVVAGRSEIPFGPSTTLAWLAERIHRGALAGLEFHGRVMPDIMLRFTQRLLGHYKHQDSELRFEEMWPEKYADLQLIDRRFEGYFDDAAAVVPAYARNWGEDEESSADQSEDAKSHRKVARLVAEDDAVQDHMERLRVQIQTQQGRGPTRRIDVLPRIVKLLPHDALQHYDRAVAVTKRILGLLEDRLAEETWQENLRAFDDDATLNQLLLATSRGILGSRAPSAEEIAERLEKEKRSGHDVADDAPRGARPEDEGVLDDVQLLWQDMDDLPPPHSGELTAANAESLSEQLGVYLHILVYGSKDEWGPAFYRQLTNLFHDAGPERMRTLLKYLRATAEDGNEQKDRLLRALRILNLQPRLRAASYLTSSEITRTFPRRFGLYLESLDTGNSSHMDELQRVCADIGPRRIREAQAVLVEEEGVLEEPALERILSRASEALLPLARVVLSAGDDSLRVRVVEVLKRLRVELREACLLYLWSDPRELPLEYLLTIADPERTEEDLAALRSTVSRQLCRYLDSDRAAQASTDKRVYAIQHLATFGREDAQQLLGALLNKRRAPFVPKEPKAVRSAARKALNRIRVMEECRNV